MFETLLGKPTAQPEPKPEIVFLQSSEFVTGSQLSTLIGLDAQAGKGTPMPEGDTTPWIIIRDGTKVVCFPQKPLRHSISYRALEPVGLGNKVAVIQGGSWLVRLFNDPDGATTTEWSTYIYGVCGEMGAQYGKWAKLTFNDLGIGDTNTTNQALAAYVSPEYNQYQYYQRGYKNNLQLKSNQNKDNVFASCGWRPILIWQSGDQPWV